MLDSIRSKVRRCAIIKRKYIAKIKYAFLKTRLRSVLISTNENTPLKVIPIKTWGPDLYIRNFNEYMIPGKNRVYKIKLDEISSYLLDSEQPIRILADLHSFSWMGHVGIVANKNIRKVVKHHVSFWIQNFSNAHGIAWAPIVVARRVFRWLTCYFVIKSAEKELLDEFLKSIHIQAQFIYKIRGLYNDIEWVTTFYKSLLAYAMAAEKPELLNQLAEELKEVFGDIKLDITHLSTISMCNTLVDLLEIKMLSPIEIDDINTLAVRLRDNLATANTDAGLGIFNSLYTPTRQYVNTVLSTIDVPSIALSSERFIRASAFESDLVIDKNSPWFMFNFHFAKQLAGISNSIILSQFDNQYLLGEEVCKYKSESEKGYFLFSANSSHKYSNGDVAFSRRLYMNNLGTELRGEDVISSMTTGSFISEFIVSENVKVSKLAYQNGLNIEFLSGKKWLLLLGDNIDLSSTKLSEKIINGTETNSTIVRLEVYKSADKDCVCKWSLKEI